MPAYLQQAPSPWFEYYFIDSLHTAEFAREFFIPDLLEPRLRATGPREFVGSVHDVYATGTLAEEGLEVVSFLDRSGVAHYTLSDYESPALHAAAQRARREHGLGYGEMLRDAALAGDAEQLWVPGLDVLPLTINVEASMLFFGRVRA